MACPAAGLGVRFRRQPDKRGPEPLPWRPHDGPAAMNEAIRNTILDGERALIAAQADADAATVERLLSEGFREIGSSGRYFDKREVLGSLDHSKVTAFHIEPIEWLEVDEACVVLVYISTATRRHASHAATRRAYRSSTWRCEQGTWRMVFHQGTPLPP